MDVSNPTTLGWLSFAAAIAAVGVAYLAWSRRKLTIWHASARLINAAPVEQLEIAVSHRGQPVDQPVYMVHLQMKCAGNRDIAMAAEREFVEIETADGIEMLYVRYGTPGKFKLEVIESTSKSQKFRFDLLKRGQTMVFNIYVKSTKDLEKIALAKQFPVAVQIRDVQSVILATNRYELWGGAVAAIGFFGLMGGFYLVQSFAPIDPSRLLVDDSQKGVALRSIGAANAIEVCEVTTSPWEDPICRDRPLSEVAAFQPAPADDPSLYLSGAPVWSRLGSLLLMLFAVAMFGFGSEIARGVGRIWDKIKPTNQTP